MSDSPRELSYCGDGDYEAVLNDTVTLALHYDGSDYMVGDWHLVGLLIDGEHIPARDVLGGDMKLVRWLEDEARKYGHLPNEPEGENEDA